LTAQTKINKHIFLTGVNRVQCPTKKYLRYPGYNPKLPNMQRTWEILPFLKERELINTNPKITQILKV